MDNKVKIRRPASEVWSPMSDVSCYLFEITKLTVLT
jgi:hypothetical protein